MSFVSKRIKKDSVGLLILDVQERLFCKVERQEEVCSAIEKVMKGFGIFRRPIVLTEQAPSHLGRTLDSLMNCVDGLEPPLEKTSFSCIADKKIREALLALPVQQWVLVGLEAHICVLQTAKDLLRLGKEVAVLNDAISSRSIFDFSTAIAELRDCGVRISSVETLLFELLRDAKDPHFKAISALVKQVEVACCAI